MYYNNYFHGTPGFPIRSHIMFNQARTLLSFLVKLPELHVGLVPSHFPVILRLVDCSTTPDKVGIESTQN